MRNTKKKGSFSGKEKIVSIVNKAVRTRQQLVAACTISAPNLYRQNRTRKNIWLFPIFPGPDFVQLQLYCIIRLEVESAIQFIIVELPKAIKVKAQMARLMDELASSWYKGARVATVPWQANTRGHSDNARHAQTVSLPRFRLQLSRL